MDLKDAASIAFMPALILVYLGLIFTFIYYVLTAQVFWVLAVSACSYYAYDCFRGVRLNEFDKIPKEDKNKICVVIVGKKVCTDAPVSSGGI